MTKVSNFRYDIAFLRCIAVISVVLYHAKFPYFHGGFIGVDIFFVISGYLMTNIILKGLQRGNFNLLEFYSRRVNRIFPALLVPVIALLIVVYFTLGLKLGETIDNALFSSLFVSNIHYYNTSGYFDSLAKSNLLLHTWSLSVEWQFYMVYPLILMGGSKIWGVAKKLKFLIYGSTIASVLLCWYYFMYDQSFSFYMVHTRAWEMLMGGIAFIHADWFKQKLSRNIRCTITYVGFLTIALCMINVIKVGSHGWPSQITLVPVIATFGIMLSNVELKIFKLRISNFISDVSYSWYLWHWPIFVIAGYFTVNGGIALKIIMILISFVLAVLSYFLIEKKTIQLPTKSIISSTAMIAVLTLTLSNMSLDKYLMTSYERNIAQFVGDYNEIYAPDQFDFGKGHIESESNFSDWDSVHLLNFDKERSNYLLLGDSHAGMFSKSLSNMAERNNINLLQATADATFPSPGSQTFYSAPKMLNDYVFSHYIPTYSNEIDTVIISANYAPYLNTNLQDYIQNIESYFSRYQIPVIYIGQTESYSAEFPIVQSMNLRFGISIEKYQEDYKLEANEWLKNSAISQRYIDIYNNKDIVKFQDGKAYIYDNDHLSKFGADQYITVIERYLFKR